MYAKFLIGVLWAGMAQGAQAGQPISVSLSECSALYAVMGGAGVVKDRLGGGHQQKLMIVANAYVEQAVVEAEAEGAPDPMGDVSAVFQHGYEKWQAQLTDVRLFQDTKDWLDYCDALGRHRKLPVLR